MSPLSVKSSKPFLCFLRYSQLGVSVDMKNILDEIVMRTGKTKPPPKKTIRSLLISSPPFSFRILL